MYVVIGERKREREKEREMNKGFVARNNRPVLLSGRCLENLELKEISLF